MSDALQFLFFYPLSLDAGQVRERRLAAEEVTDRRPDALAFEQLAQIR
jgi:hypothetical protein